MARPPKDPTRSTEFVRVDFIETEGRHRTPTQDSVQRLAASMKEIGLQTPITVRWLPDRPSASGSDDSYVLVAGAHRLAAAKLLGWEKIEVFNVGVGDYQDKPIFSDLDAELWEIDENLMRAELTEVERTTCMTRRKKIYVEKHPETKKGAFNQHTSANRQIGEKQNDRFTKDTAEKTGISERVIQRAVTRGEKIGEENLHKLVGTSLDKGVELDALASLPKEQQAPLIERAVAGELVSARIEPPTREMTAAERQMKINNACVIIRAQMREIARLTGSQTLATKIAEDAMRAEFGVLASEFAQ